VGHRRAVRSEIRCAARRQAREARALEHAGGFLRSEVSRRIKLFTVPQLHFVYDQSIERGMHMTQLINQVAEADQALRVDDEDDSSKPAE